MNDSDNKDGNQKKKKKKKQYSTNHRLDLGSLQLFTASTCKKQPLRNQHVS